MSLSFKIWPKRAECVFESLKILGRIKLVVEATENFGKKSKVEN